MNSLRFDLHSNGFNIKSISALAEEVFDFTFKTDEKLGILLTFWCNKFNSEFLAKEFVRMIKDMKLEELGLKATVYIAIPTNGDECKYRVFYYFEIPKKHHLIDELREMSLTADIGGYKGYNPRVYYISENQKVLMNIYDDRGLDLISAEKRNLERVYKTFHKNLLKYDIEKMQKSFEQH